MLTDTGSRKEKGGVLDTQASSPWPRHGSQDLIHCHIAPSVPGSGDPAQGHLALQLLLPADLPWHSALFPFLLSLFPQSPALYSQSELQLWVGDPFQ